MSRPRRRHQTTPTAPLVPSGPWRAFVPPDAIGERLAHVLAWCARCPEGMAPPVAYQPTGEAEGPRWTFTGPDGRVLDVAEAVDQLDTWLADGSARRGWQGFRGWAWRLALAAS
jgi:hypothetical protein